MTYVGSTADYRKLGDSDASFSLGVGPFLDSAHRDRLFRLEILVVNPHHDRLRMTSTQWYLSLLRDSEIRARQPQSASFPLQLRGMNGFRHQGNTEAGNREAACLFIEDDLARSRCTGLERAFSFLSDM
jgi:hypothetical protein